MARITITDVARAAGVSRTTVSMVLSGNPRISVDTAARVRQAARDLGYVYNRAAGAIRAGRSSLFGCVLTDIRNPFFAELIMAADRAVDRLQGSLIQGFSYDDATREARLVRTLIEQQVGGVILLPTSETTPTSLDLPAPENMPPLVQLLRRVPGLAADFVGIDNHASGRLLGQHLAEQGLRKVHMVGGRHRSRLFEERRAGIAAALGTTVTASADSREFSHWLTTSTYTPDAVVTYQDTYTVQVWQILGDHGLTPGRNIAVASFDNTPVTQDLHPAVTSVDHHTAELATACVQTITERMAQPELPLQELLVTPELVVRDSTRRD